MASPAPAPAPVPARGLPCGATRCPRPCRPLVTAAQGGSPRCRRQPTLDAAAVRTWCSLALEALGREREEIDAINVYPVADGDTGTNLYLTVESAAQAVEAVFAAHETGLARVPAPRRCGAGDGPRRADRRPRELRDDPGAAAAGHGGADAVTDDHLRRGAAPGRRRWRARRSRIPSRARS